jgi:hypothetical protein
MLNTLTYGLNLASVISRFSNPDCTGAIMSVDIDSVPSEEELKGLLLTPEHEIRQMSDTYASAVSGEKLKCKKRERTSIIQGLAVTSGLLLILAMIISLIEIQKSQSSIVPAIISLIGVTLIPLTLLLRRRFNRDKRVRLPDEQLTFDDDNNAMANGVCTSSEMYNKEVKLMIPFARLRRKGTVTFDQFKARYKRLLDFRDRIIMEQDVLLVMTLDQGNGIDESLALLDSCGRKSAHRADANGEVDALANIHSLTTIRQEVVSRVRDTPEEVQARHRRTLGATQQA